MKEKMSLEQIKTFWTEQAQLHGASPAASWSDQCVIDMEIREVLARLTDGDRVLDVGCANGYTAIQLASQKRLHIRGLDYVPEMINAARQRQRDLPAGALAGTLDFDFGDITQLPEPASHYDKVLVVRVVINLEDWARQHKGLRECVRVLKPGGTLLLSEATLQGWHRMNQFRTEWGLSEIPMPGFNHYLDEAKVVAAVAPELTLVELVNFASTYYVGTRVLKPLLAQVLGGTVNPAKPDMEWNRWFAQLPASGDYGVQKLFVFRKR